MTSQNLTRFSAIAYIIALVGCSSTDGNSGAGGSAGSTDSGSDANTTDGGVDTDATASDDAPVEAGSEATVVVPSEAGDARSDVATSDVVVTSDATRDGGAEAAPDASVADVSVESSVGEGGDSTEAGGGYLLPGCTPKTFPHVTPSSTTILDAEGTEKFTQSVPQNQAGNWDQILPDPATAGSGMSSPWDYSLVGTPHAGSGADNLHAIHSTGSGYSGQGGIGIGLLQDFGAPLDASAYPGVTFWAKGSPLTGSLTVQAGLSSTLAPNEAIPNLGCECDPGSDGGASRCNDNPYTQVALTQDWQKYTLTWSQFHQDGYGTPVPTDPHKLLNFVIRANGAGEAGVAGSWDFWIDDIAFTTP